MRQVINEEKASENLKNQKKSKKIKESIKVFLVTIGVGGLALAGGLMTYDALNKNEEDNILYSYMTYEKTYDENTDTYKWIYVGQKVFDTPQVSTETIKYDNETKIVNVKNDEKDKDEDIVQTIDPSEPNLYYVYNKFERPYDETTNTYGDWMYTEQIFSLEPQYTDTENAKYMLLGRYHGIPKDKCDYYVYQKYDREYDENTGIYGEWKETETIIEAEPQIEETDTTKYMYLGSTSTKNPMWYVWENVNGSWTLSGLTYSKNKPHDTENTRYTLNFSKDLTFDGQLDDEEKLVEVRRR